MPVPVTMRKQGAEVAVATESSAAMAAQVYNARTKEIRCTLDRGSREFATAMTEACAEYEAAMTADLGHDGAARLGAHLPSIA